MSIATVLATPVCALTTSSVMLPVPKLVWSIVNWLALVRSVTVDTSMVVMGVPVTKNRTLESSVMVMA